MPAVSSRTTRTRMTEQPSNGNPRSSGISPDLVPRTIYFPPKWLARVEAQGPGSLIALLTVALSAHLKGGGQ